MSDRSSEEEKTKHKQTWAVAALAALLFVPLFITRGFPGFDFWWWMAANLVVLLALTAFLDPAGWVGLWEDWRHRLGVKLGAGLLSAGVLYLVFGVGNFLARRLFPFAGSGIADVYAFKVGASGLRIALLMALVIGPGEELFWRCFLQRRLQEQWGGWRGFLAATGLYCLVHVSSGNLMLVLAAAVCGVFWGLLYWRWRSAALNVVSHTVWDLAVFLLFPFGG